MKPSHLPKVRDQVAGHLSDPDGWVLRGSGVTVAEMAPTVTALRSSTLYWVTPDMAALAMSSGTQLEAARWATADQAAPCGLVVFDGGIGHFAAHGIEVPVDACSWGPGQEGNCVVGLWANRRRFEAVVSPAERLPPLVPLGGHELPVTAGPVPMAQLPAGVPRPVMASLAAAWLLMRQPTLVDRRTEQPDRSVRRAYARQDRPIPDVTIVDLRRQYVPDVQEPDGVDTGRYRWL